jgi:hypothetical protein
VVETVAGVLSSLYGQMVQLQQPDDHGALLTSIVGVAVKRGSLPHILQAIKYLLEYDAIYASAGGASGGDGDVSWMTFLPSLSSPHRRASDGPSGRSLPPRTQGRGPAGGKSLA